MCKGEAGVHVHPVFTLPACTTSASPSPPLGIGFFSCGGEGGGLGGIGFRLGYVEQGLLMGRVWAGI